MRIVHLIARLNDGGPARVLAEWCKESSRLGHEVRILCGYCSDDEPDIGPDLIAQGIHVDYLDQMGRKPSPLRDLKSLFTITRYLRRYRPDILHTHTAKAGLLGRLCARYLTLPCLHSYHGHVLNGYWSPIVSGAIALCERLAARWGHCHTLTISLVKELRDTYRIGQPNKWHCLAIPIAPLTPSHLSPGEIATKYHLSNWTSHIPCIGFLGRLAPVKDPQLFIETMKSLAQDMDIQVLIAGDGTLRRSVTTTLKDLPCSSRSWSVGFIPANEALALIDVLVLTSHNEGTPLTIIEAASLNTPVVAAEVGGIRDLADTSFLRKVTRDQTSLANGIKQQLQQNPSSLTQDAMGLYRRYQPSILTPHYIELYQRITSSTQRARIK